MTPESLNDCAKLLLLFPLFFCSFKFFIWCSDLSWLASDFGMCKIFGFITSYCIKPNQTVSAAAAAAAASWSWYHHENITHRRKDGV